MSLLGKGLVAIWNGITEEGRANFYEWHNREHIPERLGVAGFLRGRRYVALEGTPQYFTLYEVSDASVLASDNYLARLNAPTEWTTRSVQHFRDVARSLCRTDVSLGAGSGGTLGTLRFDCAPEQDAELLRRLEEEVLPELADGAELVGAHVGRADLQASSAKTAEQSGRPANAVPRWVVLIEGSDADPIRAALGGALGSEALSRYGLEGAARGIYQLQFDLLAGR